ncbi:Type-5 uracil-DNA glycosylase [Pleomorphomonas sp. T1.2MG-36]|uniref:uracil-DNA glycosylase n=1 Tax=Pleomorphomonas sp. T1.2MG-36 TaxID=3041167 RepID=UPI0024774B9A|nr:uracil-DNA glycosylase [Pleomorphomonas sp. T1.2MG-36]CAI9398781.1 Type-5 uracil-DNA glycosylase [Pleomorphomonas sp. T1.2MG-36]
MSNRSVVAEFAGHPVEPDRNCGLCPRLVAFRHAQREAHPDWHNAPVPTFGTSDARLLIAGLAPGLRGANRTGRAFTGDYAGDLLYETMSEFGFARGVYRADPNDGFELVDAAISNSVRCVPPENKPTNDEINNCRRFFAATLATFSRLSAIIALGKIAHDQLLKTLKVPLVRHKFAHGAVHTLDCLPGIRLYDSYHCSRYNTNTGVLTPEMFRAVFAAVRRDIDSR